jgi:hypothetical protein
LLVKSAFIGSHTKAESAASGATWDSAARFVAPAQLSLEVTRGSDDARMNHAVAQTLLDQELARLRELGWPTLRNLIPRGTDVKEIAGADGVAYQLESIVLWDAVPDGRIRLLVNVHDGGWRYFLPLTADDLIEPT